MNHLTLYREAKERHPGMVLLFRMGDFYESFELDAETCARVLGLSLTVRSDGVPISGFPHQSLESHLRKLLKAGHRVAICDEIQDHAPRGAQVNRIVTPGYGADVPRQPTLFAMFD
jgi:DNA mismatch repair protein MutS